MKCVAAIGVVLLALGGAASAVASTWAGPPQPGSYKGKDARGDAVSFRSTSGGSRLTGIKVVLSYQCQSFPVTDTDPDGSTPVPAGGGQVTLTLARLRTGNPADFTVKVPGASAPAAFEGEFFFTKHTPVPPNPTSGQFLVGGGFDKDNGDSCAVPGDDGAKIPVKRR
jgi:hypothetical protein